jgi:hypothetical protein
LVDAALAIPTGGEGVEGTFFGDAVRVIVI